MKDDKEKKLDETRNQIIELIVLERKNWFEWLDSMGQRSNVKKMIEKSKKQKAVKDTRLEKETKIFRKNIRDCWQMMNLSNDLEIYIQSFSRSFSDSRTARFRFCGCWIGNIKKDSERESCGANVRFEGAVSTGRRKHIG